jgi:hypothetical protein
MPYLHLRILSFYQRKQVNFALWRPNGEVYVEGAPVVQIRDSFSLVTNARISGAVAVFECMQLDLFISV